jgi:glycosyltransferase involved in cell wall biosynthesis
MFVLGTTAGGTGAHVRSLAAGLIARGAGVSVAGPAATERMLGFTSAGARFIAVEIADRPRPMRDAAAVLRLWRLLRAHARGARQRPKRQAAVVHAHGLRAGALAALARCGQGGTPALVVTLHNAPPAGGGSAGLVYRVLEHIVARRADRVLCVSPDLAERARRLGARSAGPAVVPAPAAVAVTADAARAARAGLGSPGRPVILAAGRLAAQKGFGTLCAAAAMLTGCDPQPLVVIAGDGPLRAELATRIDAQRLPVRLIGHRGDIPALMAAAGVFVLPSVWEGQPLILQEALRAGLPIVATRVGGIPALTGPDAAMLVPPGDAGQLGAAIRRVLTDPAHAARMAAAAAKQARSLPTEADAVDAVLADYAAVSGHPGR